MTDFGSVIDAVDAQPPQPSGAQSGQPPGALPTGAPLSPTGLNAPPPATPRLPFADVVDDYDSARQQQANALTFTNQETDPDKAARAQFLGKTFGVPGAVIEPDLAKWEQRYQLTQNNLVLRANPTLTDWLIDNPESARIAADDFQNLSLVSKLGRSLSQGWSGALLENQRGRIGSDLQLGIAPESEQSELGGIEQKEQSQPTLSGVYSAASKLSGFAGGLLDNFLQGGTAGAVAGGGVGALGDGVGAVPGAVIGGGIGINADMARVSAGNTYLDLGKVRDTAGNPLDEGARQAGAVMTGLLTYAVGRYGGEAMQRVVSPFASEAVAQAVAQPTVQRALVNFTKAVAGAGVEGALVNAGMEGASILGEETAKQLSAGDFETAFNDPVRRQEILDRLTQSAIDGAELFGAGGLVTHGIGLRSDLLRSRQAQIDAGQFQALAEGSQASKLRERSPDAFQQFLHSQLDGSPAESLFIPGEKVAQLYQNLGAEPGPTDPIMGHFVPDIAQQIEQARATGGDVVLPTSGYAAHLVGTDVDQALRGDLKVRQDGMSLNEATEYEKNRSALLASQGERFRQAADASAETQAPIQAVYEDAFSKLRQAGYTNDTAAQNASIVAARYATRADRLEGQAGNALDLYRGEGLDIRRVLPEGLARPDVQPELDGMLNDLRNGAKQPNDRTLYGPSLTDWLVKNGGVIDQGGELAAMDAGKLKPRLIRRPRRGDDSVPLIGERGPNPDAPYDPDAAALRAQEAGYFPAGERPTPNDLFNAISDDLGGRKRYAENSRDPRADRAETMTQLEHYLGSIGVDLATTDNATARQRMLAAQSDTAPVAEETPEEPLRIAAQRYDQSPVTLRGDELGAPDRPFAERRDAAKAAFDQIRAQGPVEHPQLGSIQFSGASKGKTFRGVDDTKLSLIPALRDIIANGKLVATEASRKEVQNVRAYHTLETAVRLGDHDYTARTTIREDNSGRFYYDIEGRRDLAQKGGAEPPEGGLAGPPVARSLEQKISAPDDGINLQLEQPARGSISFMGNGRKIIELYKNADLSTFIHEMGHEFLDELGRDAARPDAPDQVKADHAAVLNWLGVDRTEDITIVHHEQWARGFERYMMEGKAPSGALAAVFAKFKAWLTSIYRNLKALNAPISNEIRSVMDRLLATDDEIAQARRQQSMNPIFADAEAAGMTKAEFGAYTKQVGVAQRSAEEKLLAKTMAVIRKQKTAEWERDREAMRAQVEDETTSRPDLQADSYLRTGKLIHERPDLGEMPEKVKLDRQAIADLYGSTGVLDELPRGITGADGVHPDDLAPMFGYRSGDAMLRDLMSVESLRRQARADTGKPRLDLLQHLIDEETDARMFERHGDPLSDGSIESEALAAVHSDRQAAVIATEMKALGRQLGVTPLTIDGMRRWAEGRVSSEPVLRGINWQRHARDEAKAARDAERGLLKGDVTAAFQAKQRQVLAHLMTEAAKSASEDYESGHALMLRMASKATFPAIEQEYTNRIHDILNRIGYLPKRDAGELDRALGNTTLEGWLGGKIAEGREIPIAAFLLDERFKSAPDDLTVDQFRGIADAIRSLAHNGRDEKAFVLEGQRVEREQLWGEAREQFDQMAQRTPSRRYDQTLGQRLLSRLKDLDGNLLKAEQILDWVDHDDPNGVFNRVVMRPLKEAQTRENDLRVEAAERMRALHDQLGPEFFKGLDKAIPDQPEFIDRTTGEPMVLTRKNLLAIALNSGSEDSLTKLAAGYGWSPAAITSALDRLMSKPDWDFVQGVWDQFEHHWPDIEAMERRLSGVAPPKIEARAISTEHGAYRGGYYPLVYDPLRSFDVELKRQRNSDLFENNYQRATTPKGHTIARVDGVQQPVQLSLDVIPWKLNQTIHDLAFREAVMTADRFLQGRPVREGFQRTLGTEYYKQLRPWLQSIANAPNTDIRALAGWDRVLHQARINMTMVGIGFRFTTMLKHGMTALSNSVGELGPQYMLAGSREFFGTPEKMRRATEFVFSRSGEMRNRMNEIDRDIRDAMNDVTGETSWRADAMRFGHYGVAMLDYGSAMPTWLGAYRRGIDGGMNDADASYAADKAVRKAHGANSVVDTAAVQRGHEAFKLLTMFYGFFNHIYNRERDTAMRAGHAIGSLRAGDYAGARRDFAMVLARSFYYVAIPAIIEGLVTQGGPSDDEGWGSWAGRQILGEIPAGLPIVRDIAKAAISGREYELSPVAKMVETALGTLKDVESAVGAREKPESSRWLQHAAETAGYATGLPTGQAGASAQYLWDIHAGTESPQSVGELLHGLMYGPAPKKKAGGA